MRDFLLKLKSGIIMGFGFIFIVGVTNAWTGLISSSGDTLTAAKWNELVAKVEDSSIVRQMILLNNDVRIHNPSSSFTDYWTMNISNVQSGSKIMGEISISSLFEGSQGQERGVFKGTIQIASLRHKNAMTSGWGMHNPVLMFEDLNPNVGDNSYILKMRVSTSGYFNYGTADRDE